MQMQDGFNSGNTKNKENLSIRNRLYHQGSNIKKKKEVKTKCVIGALTKN